MNFEFCRLVLSVFMLLPVLRSGSLTTAKDGTNPDFKYGQVEVK